MDSSLPDWITKLTLREKGLLAITALAVVWFTLEMAMKPALEAYKQRRGAISRLESEKTRIGALLSQGAEFEKRIRGESQNNARLKERLSELRERLKSASAIHGGGLDFLQTIINSSGHASAEMNIHSEPMKKAQTAKAEPFTAAGDDEPVIVRSRVVLKLETGFRELASIINRVETSRLPVVMRKLDVAVDQPLVDFLRAEIEMDIFSL